MSEPNCYLAIDLGAESGRVIVGSLQDGRLSLEEMHRFANGPVPVLGTQRWNLVQLWSEILQGLRAAAIRVPVLKSVSVDSWGVDYVLVRGREPLLGPAFHYRDPRTHALYEKLRKEPGEAYIYERTGIQFMPLNSLYQLVADVQRDRGWVEAADGLLMIADWFHWLMTGRRTVEETNASTTQLYNPEKGVWAWDLIERLHLPAKLFNAEVIRPGAIIGPMDADTARAAGFLGHVPTVVACCTHDTGSAVVAVPAAEGDDWAYLSSGTWSLIGVELPSPMLTEGARKANFTNEIGFGGTIRFLRNVIGLWLLQECRRQWNSAGTVYDYAELMTLADEAQPFRSIIHADDPRFLPPGDMVGRIQAFCRETRQPEPQTPGEITRCILESLALLYAVRLDELERVTGRILRKVHVVGGGSRSALLNQLTADATQREVISGPVEGTAIGNLLVQAVGMGDLSNLTVAREVVARSFPVNRFTPRAGSASAWEQVQRRLSSLAKA